MQVYTIGVSLLISWEGLRLGLVCHVRKKAVHGMPSEKAAHGAREAVMVAHGRVGWRGRTLSRVQPVP